LLRRGLALGPPHAAPALERARKGAALDLAAGIATLATGLLYASPPGRVELRVGILAGLALALTRLALLVGVARPVLRRTAAALAGGDLEAARAASSRLPAYAGSAHLVWMLALVFMVFPI